MLYVVSACTLKYKVVLRINMKQNRLYETVNKRPVYSGQVSAVCLCATGISVNLCSLALGLKAALQWRSSTFLDKFWHNVLKLATTLPSISFSHLHLYRTDWLYLWTFQRLFRRCQFQNHFQITDCSLFLSSSRQVLGECRKGCHNHFLQNPYKLLVITQPFSAVQPE